MPSPEYSRTINRIDKSPLAYLLILYTNAQALTELVFRKKQEHRDVRAHFRRQCSGERAAYILTKTDSSSPLALQKELYQ